MDNGAAILDFGSEFGPNSVERAMRNDGPNLADNHLSANKVTGVGGATGGGSMDAIKHMTDTPGYTIAKGVGLGGTP